MLTLKSFSFTKSFGQKPLFQHLLSNYMSLVLFVFNNTRQKVETFVSICLENVHVSPFFITNSLSLSLNIYIYINYCIGSLIEIFFVGLKFGRTVHYISKEKS